MKKAIITTVIALGFAVHSWGQEVKFKPGDLIQLKTLTQHKGTDVNDSIVLDFESFEPNYLQTNISFEIVKIDSIENKYWLTVSPNFKERKCNRFLFFKRKCRDYSSWKANAIEKKDKSAFYNNKIFSVSEVEFLAKAEIAEKYQPDDRVSFGLITLPFKFRMFDDKSFETNFNLNTTLNIRLTQLWNAGFYAQFGAGIGNTNLYNGNAPGVDPGEEINAAALTILSGVMLQYKKVQAGLYIGWDHINNQKNYQWQYNGKPWLGFGVGYQLFKIDLGGDKKQNKQ